MANRTLNEINYTFVKKPITLFPIVNVGAAGAVTLQKRVFSAAGTGGLTAKSALSAAPTTGILFAVGDGAGTKSVVRNSTGNWTITLQDSYQYLIQCTVQFANSGAAFNAPLMVVDSAAGNTNVTLNTAPGTGGKITVQFYNGSGVATDPGVGDQAQFAIVLGDATEP